MGDARCVLFRKKGYATAVLVLQYDTLQSFFFLFAFIRQVGHRYQLEGAIVIQTVGIVERRASSFHHFFLLHLLIVRQGKGTLFFVFKV